MISVLTSVSRGCSGCLRANAKQMLGELGAARRGLVDHPGDGRKLRLIGDRLPQDFDRSGDDGQDVVEVVGDAAGELADRFHLLGMPDPVFRRDLVGEVADEPVEHDAAAAPQLGDAELDLDLVAVTPQRLDLEPAAEDLALAGAQEMFEAGAVIVAMNRRDDQVAEFLADRLGARPAEDLLGLRIPVGDDPAFVHLHEGIERGIDDAARELLAFAQALLREPALGHVAADEEIALDRFGPCAEPGQRHRASVLVEHLGIGDFGRCPRRVARISWREIST